MLKYSQQFIAQYGKVDISSYIAEQVDNWHSLHYSRVGRKKPEELNVLFLCGPNPSNDIQMLRDLGVSLHNIWAIEGDANAYEMAKKELIEVGLPVKLHRGSLQEFFAVVPQTFDIVYFDACGPLFGGKPNTIHVLRELFVNQRLTPLSALITNFSAANQDAQHPDMWSKRLASWYAARYEEPVAFDGEIFDRTQEINRYLQHINENLHEYYSDFISRFIIEFSSQLLPWWRVYALPAAKREYFAEPKLLDAAVKASMKLPNVEEIDLDNIFANFGHAQLSNNSYPLLWAAERTKEYLKPNDPMRDFFHNNSIRTGSLI